MIGRAARMGDVFGDAWDVVSDVFSTGGDWIRDIPGFQDASEALVDFARTPVGTAVFRAMSLALYTPLAWELGFTIGPQLASIVFALPGLLRGDSFDEAWLTEVSWRSEEATKVLLPEVASAYGAELADALVKLAPSMPDISEGLSAIAIEFGIEREDIVYLALQKLHGELELIIPPPEFDPKTGKQITLASSAKLNRFDPNMIARNESVDAYNFSTNMLSATALPQYFAPAPAPAPTPTPRPIAPIRAVMPQTKSEGPPVALIGIGAAVVVFGGFLLYRASKRRRK